MRTIVIALFVLQFAGVAPAAAQAWLSVADADGCFRIEIPIPFDLSHSESELDGTVTVSYLHETSDVALRLDVVDVATCCCGLSNASLVVADHTETQTQARQTRTWIVGSRTYRMSAGSKSDFDNDAMIHRFLGSMQITR
jgi:hypothetical protein